MLADNKLNVDLYFWVNKQMHGSTTMVLLCKHPSDCTPFCQEEYKSTLKISKFLCTEYFCAQNTFVHRMHPECGSIIVL